jgi:hypothetical protein
MGGPAEAGEAMPGTVNGVGTSVCKAGADVGWNSYDAVECLVVGFMPILPYSAVHTFDWNGNQYRRIPIRWSAGLVARAYLRAWRWGFLVAALILGVVGFVDIHKTSGVVCLAVGFLLACVFAFLTALVILVEQRHNNVRRVLGPHVLGSCDPAALVGKTLEAFEGNPRMQYGADSYALAVPRLLEEGRYSQAMWAARLSAALEDRTEGESLTDEVLGHPEVIACLEKVRRDPGCWQKVMLNEQERAALAQQQVRQAGYE